MKRRNFLLAIGAAALGCNEKIVGPTLRPPKPTPIPSVPQYSAVPDPVPVRQWKMFDVAFIPHAGMCVCVLAGTDETAIWQKSEKWERVFKDENYLPRKLIVPVHTSSGMHEVTYAPERDAFEA